MISVLSSSYLTNHQPLLQLLTSSSSQWIRHWIPGHNTGLPFLLPLWQNKPQATFTRLPSAFTGSLCLLQRWYDFNCTALYVVHKRYLSNLYPLSSTCQISYSVVTVYMISSLVSLIKQTKLNMPHSEILLFTSHHQCLLPLWYPQLIKL